MIFKENEVYEGFRLNKKQIIKELNIEGYYFEHELSGAQLIYLATDDTNNVFSMTFKTLPKDHTGVAHIVEHAVCCASEKYPLKDTFMEMDKGSLNTALNACTYKDMTMYYAASQNHKDLNQLIEVYMDLVFHPLFKKEENIFRQEGWYYDLESEEGPIYNGIVYNEMKGIYTEAGTRLEKIVHEVLFDNTPYAYDSGGIPKEILKLKWEDAIDFHDTYYRADNVTFFFYGNSDITKHMQYLNQQHLKNMPRSSKEGKNNPSNTNQQSQYEVSYYPATEEDESKKNYMNLTFVVGQGLNGEERLAFQMLEHMLLRSAASPLQKVLIEEKQLATSLAAGGYDPGKKEATFSVTLTGAKEASEDSFKILFFETIEQLVEEGIDASLIDAAIDIITFSLYECESEGEPLGILYSEDVQLSLNYGGNPFEYLIHEKHLQTINELKNKGYFEALLKKWFLKNERYVQVILKPSWQLEAEEENEEQQKLISAIGKMGIEEKKKLSLQNRDLEEKQITENTKEEIACLPKLTLDDLQEGRKAIKYKEYEQSGVPIIATIEQTRQISYYHILLDASKVSKEEWNYLGVLATLLTYISTSNKHYTELENEINSKTGALNCTINAYGDTFQSSRYTPYFKISTKMLDAKSEEVIHLLYEIMTKTCFNEKDKIHELLESTLYDMERSFTGVPEYRATKYIYTAFSAAAQFEDAVSGIGYYRFLKELCQQYELRFETLKKTLKKLYTNLMSSHNLKIMFTTNELQENALLEHSKILYEKLPKHLSEQNQVEKINEGYKEVKALRQAFKTTSDVQAIAWGGQVADIKQFKGAWYVVAQMLESGYLWDMVRLKGGAYGCDLVMSRDGSIVACSYSDPQITKTIQVFDKIGEYLESLELDESLIERFIIKTVGILDYPLTTEQKSERAILHQLCSVKHEVLEKERKEVLATKIEDIRVVGKVFKEIATRAHYCVIGNTAKITKVSKLFSSIEKI